MAKSAENMLQFTVTLTHQHQTYKLWVWYQ